VLSWLRETKGSSLFIIVTPTYSGTHHATPSQSSEIGFGSGAEVGNSPAELDASVRSEIAACAKLIRVMKL